jgi:hypothetical protein
MSQFTAAVDIPLLYGARNAADNLFDYRLLVILKLTYFASRRTWASRAMRRALCDAIPARLARFLIAPLILALFPHNLSESALAVAKI